MQQRIAGSIARVHAQVVGIAALLHARCGLRLKRLG
jgi:hypothetical protein